MSTTVPAVQATRDSANAQLSGNGPSREKSAQSGRDRTGVQTASKGAYFLQGEMYASPPIFTPALPECYRLSR